METAAVMNHTRRVDTAACRADEGCRLPLDPRPGQAGRNRVCAPPLPVAPEAVTGKDVPRLAVEDRTGVLYLGKPAGFPEWTSAVQPGQFHPAMVTRRRGSSLSRCEPEAAASDGTGPVRVAV